MTRLWPAAIVFGIVAFVLPAAGQHQQPAQPDSAPPPAAAAVPSVEPSAAPAEQPAPNTEQLASPDAARQVVPEVAAGATPDTASVEPVPNAKARFQFVRVGDNVLKLDGDTGAIGLCSARSVGWGCQVVPEDRVALEQEIARLQLEIDGLKGEIATLKTAAAPPPPPPAPSPPAAKDSVEKNSVELKLPTEQDLQRARALVENAWRDTWHRLVEMIAHIQKDVMRKG